jgi:hypothetical protein
MPLRKRRKPKGECGILCTVVLFASGASAAKLTSGRVGENVTVCGTAASANYATHAKGQPTFLNLDKAYPHQIFTVDRGLGVLT